MLDFAIDRGGTFTDVVCRYPDGSLHVSKLLSEDPRNYADAPREGIRRALEIFTGQPHPRASLVPTAQIRSIRMGTTVATNALLERKGSRTLLVITRGFRDLLAIGTQARPRIFDLEIKRPSQIYEDVLEVDERLVLVKDRTDETLPHGPFQIVRGMTGEDLFVERAPDERVVRDGLARARARGCTSAAIVFLHSYAHGAHEALVGAWARAEGFTHVSLSHELMPVARMVPRGHTASADAYLSPIVGLYLKSFSEGFEGGLGLCGGGGDVPRTGSETTTTRVLFMQSDGGLTDANTFSGHLAVLSGPAGGCVGVARAASRALPGAPIVSFDMGGTSTDVSRFDGVLEHVMESTTAGVIMAAPQLDISTVAAGGGSRLTFRDGLFAVGPESTGAHPGPLSYRKLGGALAVTDANVALGRIVPDLFPKIFGASESEELDADGPRAAFSALADVINSRPGAAAHMTADQVAAGFVAVANEAMCRPIRELTQMKGHDLGAHTLACFGGAGPQHACAMARALGISRVFISRFAGVLSAYGLLVADVVAEAQAPCAETIAVCPPSSDVPGESNAAALATLAARIVGVTIEAVDKLRAQGAAVTSVTAFVNVRYAGTDGGIMTPLELTKETVTACACSETQQNAARDIVVALGHTASVFASLFKREFGFSLQGRAVLADDIRVRAVARVTEVDDNGPAADRDGGVSAASGASAPPPSPTRTTSIYFDHVGRVNTPVYALTSLSRGTRVAGPALLVDVTSTILVEPDFVAVILPTGDVLLEASKSSPTSGALTVDAPAFEPPSAGALSPLIGWAVGARAVQCDPIRLSIFGHRFMGIAEQCGRTLQRTAVSINIRERLDFSCALFDPDGGLIANAPHIPVHLGAMQEAVRCQLTYWGGRIDDGDVLVSNHPQLAGGSHLPDITVMTPVFVGGRIVFFLASRGHHADVGGISPGSMPPFSKVLAEEGAAIVAHKLVARGVFDDAGTVALLSAPASSGVPGAVGARNMSDCLSDLRAQVAANFRGVTLMRELISECGGGAVGTGASVDFGSGLTIVHGYMRHIQDAAAEAVRTMLVDFAARAGMPAAGGTVHAEDYMDDGTPIRLALSIDCATRSAVFDFSGTGSEVYANTNAPRAVTFSAVIYVLRCLVGVEIPLNQGCLTPVQIIVPDCTILSPSPTSAVVGGNVLTSQRVVDVILQAFKAAACSQGCMNNVLFGDSKFGYYETICGGAGAGPSWAGASGVHTHMTCVACTCALVYPPPPSPAATVLPHSTVSNSTLHPPAGTLE